MCDRSNILYQPAESSLFHENHLKTSPGHHSLICMPKKHIQSFQNCPKAFQEEKHNAEKLVECLNQKINVFQFDTLTPNKNSVDLIKSNMKNEISLGKIIYYLD